MSEESVLVCVTGQRNCHRLILTGQHVARERDAEVFVLHAQHVDALSFGSHEEAAALEYLYECSREVGAEMCVLRCEDVLQTIVDFARERRVTVVVLGTPGDRPRRGTGETFASQLSALLPNAHILEIGNAEEPCSALYEEGSP